MTFVTAWLAAAGVAAMAIPILIHLLWRQRRRPVQWAAMRFLIEAWRRHRRRLQLEQILLLAVRCLLVGVVGFALARPILKAAGVLELGGSRHVYLVIDDGLASALEESPSGATALDAQVDRAARIIEGLDPGDFVGVISAARPAQGLVVPPASDHAGVLDLLRSMEPKQAATDIEGALRVLRTAIDDEERAGDGTVAYLLSDFRAGSAPLERPLDAMLDDFGDRLSLFATVPAGDPAANVQIVAVDPLRSIMLPGAADGSGQLTIRLRRGGELGAAVSRVRVEGEEITLAEPRVVQWQPGQAEAEVEFTVDLAGQGEREIELTAVIDDDRLGADNRRYTVLESRERIRVLLIDRRSFGYAPTVDRLTPGQWIRRALEPVEDGPAAIVEVEPVALDEIDLRRTDVAILPRPDLLPAPSWRLLRDFVDRGGLLIITPPREPRVHQWVDHLPEALGLPWRVSLEVREHPEGLELAGEHAGGLLRMLASELQQLTAPIVVQRVLPVDEPATRGERVLRFADGSTLLLVGSPGEPGETENGAAPARDDAPIAQGLVALLTVAPDLQWTNLPAKPLMVPLMHELVRQGLSQIRSSRRIVVGEAGSLGVRPAARNLIGPAGERIALDGAGRPLRALERSGLWRVEDAGGQPVGALAVNIEVDAARSDPQSEAAVSAWLGTSGTWTLLPPDELAGGMGDVDAGAPIWRALLWALLALVVLETVLARWFSHSTRTLRGRRTIADETSRLALGGAR